MKKSKIIVPALGMLLLSTAASVTGTVAWFTSTQTFDTSISSFAVTKLDGDLDCVMGSGYGTTANAQGTAVTINTDVMLGDASFDHGTKTLYTNDPAYEDSEHFVALSANKLTGDEEHWQRSTTAYYALTWTMTFKYTFAGDTSSMNLYFDALSTKSLVSKTSTRVAGTEGDSYKGFRIAFISSAATIVWADNQVTAKCSYVNSTTTTASYSANLIDSANTGVSAIPAGTKGATTALNYLGTFAYNSAAPTTPVELPVTCVAWFEGSDENVIDTANLDVVTASMDFFTRVSA